MLVDTFPGEREREQKQRSCTCVDHAQQIGAYSANWKRPRLTDPNWNLIQFPSGEVQGPLGGLGWLNFMSFF